MTTTPDPFETLYDQLESTGQWYGITPLGPDGEGRIIVQRVTCGDYVQDAEIMRTFDGRGWVIYAACQCPTCLREVRVAARLQGTEVDLVAAVNKTALTLGGPESSRHQHTPTARKDSLRPTSTPNGTQKMAPRAHSPRREAASKLDVLTKVGTCAQLWALRPRAR